MHIKRKRNWKPSRIYGYVRARQLEGTIDKGSKEGVYLISANRVLAGWGAVSEKRWPYPNSTEWPIDEPLGLDTIARFNRISAYFLLRNLQDARACIDNEWPFCLTVPTHSGWPKAPNGVISMPVQGQAFTGNHCVTGVGYDDAKQLLIFQNSWGMTWGDKGFGYLPYDYYIRYMQEASFLQPPLIASKVNKEIRSGIIYLDILQINKINKPCVIHDVWDLSDNNRIGWCFGTERDGYLEVDDFFVRPVFRRKGIAKRLLSLLIQDANSAGLSLRFWISHCDVHSKTAPFAAAKRFLDDNGFILKASGVLWASYKAELQLNAESMTNTGVTNPALVPYFPPAATIELDMGLSDIEPNMD